MFWLTWIHFVDVPGGAFEVSHSKIQELISASFDDIFSLFTSFDPYPHPGGLHGSRS